MVLVVHVLNSCGTFNLFDRSTQCICFIFMYQSFEKFFSYHVTSMCMCAVVYAWVGVFVGVMVVEKFN